LNERLGFLRPSGVYTRMIGVPN